MKVTGWIIEVIDKGTKHESEKFYSEWEDVTQAIKEEYLGCANKNITITSVTLIPDFPEE